jgi:L-lactate dehydrogenase complex protein LldG
MPTPATDLRSLVGAFDAQSARIGALVHHARPADAPLRAAQILMEAGCRSVALADAVDGEGFRRALEGAALRIVAPRELWPTRRADGGISRAELGVAETGSVLLHSTADDRRVELCVDVHLILLEAGALVARLDETFALLRVIATRPPAYASLVSGPSRSADIERQITIGVHGPRALHVLLLEDSS